MRNHARIEMLKRLVRMARSFYAKTCIDLAVGVIELYGKVVKSRCKRHRSLAVYLRSSGKVRVFGCFEPVFQSFQG